MIEVLSRNFMLKLLSLGASAVLFVMLNADSDTEIEVEAPIRYEVPDGFLISGAPPSRVRLTLKGPWAGLRQYELNELDPVTIDLGHVKEPTTDRHILDLSKVQAPFGLKATSVRPAEWDITVDRKMSRDLRVELSMPGRAAFGYEIVDARVSPAEVKVTGPQNLIMGLDFIRTYPIDINEAESDVTMDVELRYPPHPAVLEQRTATVTVEIREQFVQRSFLGVPVSLEPTTTSHRPEPSEVNLTLRGPQIVLDRLDPKVLKVGVPLEPEWSKGLRSFEKSVELLQPLGTRLELVESVPKVEVVEAKSIDKN